MNWPEHPSGRPASEEGPRQCRESVVVSHRHGHVVAVPACGPHAGVLSPWGAWALWGRTVIGAGTWSLVPAVVTWGARSSSGQRPSRGRVVVTGPAVIACRLSSVYPYVYHLSPIYPPIIHPSSTHHPSINAGKSFRFWAKGLRFALSIDENVPPPGTSVAASLAAEAAGQLPLLTAPAAHASQGRDAAGARSGDRVPDARGACGVQPALCSSHPETPALLSRAAASWALIASCGFHVAPRYVCGKSCICEEAWGTHTPTLSRAPVLVGCGAPGTAGRA